LLAGLAAAVRGVYKRLRHSSGALRAARNLHRAFGDEAGDKLHSLIKELKYSQTVADVTRNLIHKHLGIGVYVCDTSGACVWVSAHMASMFGMAEHEMLGFGWVAPIKDKLKAHTSWTQCVKNKIPYSDKYVVAPINGAKAFHAVTEAMPVPAADGTILCHVGYVKRESFVEEETSI
jgi:transcriptional regulator with PAS, ATPase and Fis domain